MPRADYIAGERVELEDGDELLDSLTPERVRIKEGEHLFQILECEYYQNTKGNSIQRLWLKSKTEPDGTFVNYYSTIKRDGKKQIDNLMVSLAIQSACGITERAVDQQTTVKLEDQEFTADVKWRPGKDGGDPFLNLKNPRAVAASSDNPAVIPEDDFDDDIPF